MRRAVDEKRVRSFLRALATASDSETRVYLTGGATAVLYGWRSSTKDVDLSFRRAVEEVLASTGKEETP